MSADTYYEVWADGEAPPKTPWQADCFAHAERRARWYAARYSQRFYIERVIPRISTRNERELVASVIRSPIDKPDGRAQIWTDVQSMDALI